MTTMFSSTNETEIKQGIFHSYFSFIYKTQRSIFIDLYSPAWLQQGMHWPPKHHENKQQQLTYDGLKNSPTSDPNNKKM